MKLEDLQNVSIQLDSKTANEIADKYIQYKYFDSLLAWSCCMAFILIPCAFVIYGIRQKQRADKKREKELDAMRREQR